MREEARRLAQQALEQEIRTALEAARQEYQEVVKTERNLLALLNETKTDAFGLNQYERDYLELKRTYDNNQRLYELVLKRLKDTGVTGMLQVSNVRILDRARPSGIAGAAEPVEEPRARDRARAARRRRARVRRSSPSTRSVTTQEQVEERLGLTFLGIVPRIERATPGVEHDLSVHPTRSRAVAECLRAVRTNLLFMSPDKPLRTHPRHVVRPAGGEDDDRHARSRSRMAGSGNRVLLVDADMRRPRVHRIFGVESRVGLSSLILGRGDPARRGA